MRVVMLNDYPWAVCADDDVSDRYLQKRGEAEVRLRGLCLPDADRKSFGRVVYVRVHRVVAIP